MKTTRLVLTAALLLALAGAVFLAPSAPALAGPAEDVVAATNRQREANGLPRLKTDPDLMRAAAARARECERRFDHVRPDGRNLDTIFREYGVRWSTMAENIHSDSYRDFNADRVLVGWMNSSGHRSNILNRSVTHMGAGVHKGKDGMTYAVQLFRR